MFAMLNDQGVPQISHVMSFPSAASPIHEGMKVKVTKVTEVTFSQHNSHMIFSTPLKVDPLNHQQPTRLLKFLVEGFEV